MITPRPSQWVESAREYGPYPSRDHSTTVAAGGTGERMRTLPLKGSLQDRRSGWNRRENADLTLQGITPRPSQRVERRENADLTLQGITPRPSQRVERRENADLTLQGITPRPSQKVDSAREYGPCPSRDHSKTVAEGGTGERIRTLPLK